MIRQPFPANLPEPWAVEWGEDRHGIFQSFAVAGVVQRMRWIPPGKFLMGSPLGEVGRYDDEVQHEVELTQGYWMADTPCTQALWEVVMGENPSRFIEPKRPVERVSWEDCKVFLERLNVRIDGLGARLPTEAEWENACRGGTKMAAWLGDLEGDRELIKAPILDAIAWYHGSAVGELGGVGLKQVNPCGLHDMLGNVYEWCQDGYAKYDLAAIVDPTGPEWGAGRVMRGGSSDSFVRLVRATGRRARPPSSHDDDVGFRLVRGQGPGPGGRSPR